MKKLALLMVLVLVFSVSSVLATDAIAPISGEVVSGEEIVTTVETLVESGEEDIISGEVTPEIEEPTVDEPISGTVEETDDVVDTNSENVNNENDEEVTSSNNSATIGAIIAIVIVVAVVAIAAILRKD